MVRKKYQIFTPQKTVEQMLDLIGYFGPHIIGKTIVDLSCGNGSFLIAALTRLINECQQIKMNTDLIIKKCVNNIFGYEIDPIVFNDCLKNMNELIEKKLGIKNINWLNVHNGDGLLTSKNDFDFVVGNPPYISYRDMTPAQRDNLSMNFVGCKKGRFDYSYAFIEKSVRVLSSCGIAVIIAPINMYQIKSGRDLKDFLSSHVVKIIDVTNDNIFPKVLTNPVISVFKKNAKKANPFSDIEKQQNKIPNVLLNKKQKRFGDYYSVHNGIATLLNKAFIVDDNYDIEEEITKTAISPKSIRYNLKQKIIFPYYVSDEKLIPYEEKTLQTTFPKAYNHLLKYKSQLQKRDIGPKTKWFEYGRNQALNCIFKKKIIVTSILSKDFKPLLLDNDEIVYAGFYIVSKDPNVYPLEQVLDLLCHKSLYNYIKANGVKMNGTTYRFSCKDLENYRY